MDHCESKVHLDEKVLGAEDPRLCKRLDILG